MLSNKSSQKSLRIPIIDCFAGYIDTIFHYTQKTSRLKQLLLKNSEKINLSITFPDSPLFSEDALKLFDFHIFMKAPNDKINTLPERSPSYVRKFLANNSFILISLDNPSSVEKLLSNKEKIVYQGVYIKELTLLNNTVVQEILNTKKLLVYIPLKQRNDLYFIMKSLKENKFKNNHVIVVYSSNEYIDVSSLSAFKNVFITIPSYNFSIAKQILYRCAEVNFVDKLLFATYFPSANSTDVLKTILYIFSLSTFKYKNPLFAINLLFINAFKLFSNYIPNHSLFEKRQFIKKSFASKQDDILKRIMSFFLGSLSINQKLVFPIFSKALGVLGYLISLFTYQGWGHFLLLYSTKHFGIYTLPIASLQALITNPDRLQKYWDHFLSYEKESNMLDLFNWLVTSFEVLGLRSTEELQQCLGYKINYDTTTHNRYFLLSHECLSVNSLQPLDTIFLYNPRKNKVVAGLVKQAQKSCSSKSICISPELGILLDLSDGDFVFLEPYKGTLFPAERIRYAFNPMYHSEWSKDKNKIPSSIISLVPKLFRNNLSGIPIIPGESLNFRVNINKEETIKIIITSINDKNMFNWEKNIAFSVIPDSIKEVEVISLTEEIPLTVCVVLESSILMQKKDIDSGDVRAYLPSENIETLDRRLAAIIILSVLLTKLLELYSNINNISLVTFDNDVDVVKIKRKNGTYTHLIPISNQKNRNIRIKLLQNLVTVKTQLLKNYPDYSKLFSKLRELFEQNRNTPTFFIFFVSGLYGFGTNPIPEFYKLVNHVKDGYFLIISLGSDSSKEFIESLSINERVKTIIIKEINLSLIKDALNALTDELLKRKST